MYVVYILQSKKDKNFYIGMTGNIERRIKEHEEGKVESTRYRKPLKLLAYEVYMTKQEAMRREKYLKSSDGKKDKKKRIKESLIELER
ncbi:GIY-YIG nuclease family protein [bacterium]|nr:GIY-YIG nuclease family protein [bacterium]